MAVLLIIWTRLIFFMRIIFCELVMAWVIEL